MFAHSKSNPTKPNLKLSVLTLAVLQATSAYAQSPETGNDIEERTAYLPTVVVTATADRSNPIATTTTLNHSQVEKKQAATSDIATLLTNTSGVNVQSAGGISHLPVIRGLADNRVRVLVDGVDSISTCPNSMNSPLSFIAPSSVDNATVYAGVTPVSVGGNSIAGTVVIETAEPTFATDNKVTTSGEIGGFYRSNGNARGANVSTTVANNQLSLTYKGSIAQSDNYKAGGDFKTYTESGRFGKSIDKDEVGSTSYESRNQSVDVAYTSGDHVLQGTYLWQNVPEELYPNQRMDMLENQLDRINLRYTGKLKWGQLEAQAYKEDVDHFMDFGADKRFWYGMASGAKTIYGKECSPAGSTKCANGMPMYTSSETVGANLKGTIDLENGSLLEMGTEYHDYKLDDWWPASGAKMQPNAFYNIKDGERNRMSVYGQWEGNISSNWTTQLGARYENIKTSAGEVSGYNTVSGNQLRDSTAFNQSNRSTTDNNFDASAIARYQIDANKHIELGLAHKERTPSLYERYTWSTWPMAAAMNNTTGDGNGYFGDPNLKPEQSNTLSATLDWQGADKSWSIQATPYYSRIDDYVDAKKVAWNTATSTFEPATLTPDAYNVLRYTNQDARIYGLDISADKDLASNAWGDWGLSGSLNYTNGKNRDTGDNLYNIMPLNASLALNHEHNGWKNKVEVVAVDAKTKTSAVRNELKTSGYGLLNLSTGYQFKDVSIEAGIENVLDKNYDLPLGGAYMGQGKTMAMNKEMGTTSNWGTSVPGAGRSVYVGLNYKF